MPIESRREEFLGDILTLEYGASLPETHRSGGDFPVYGSNGEVGWHDSYLVSGPGIIVGRKGSVGAVAWSAACFWPIDTTYYVVPKDRLNLRWCYWLLRSLPLRRLDNSTGVPGLNRNDVYRIRVLPPPPSEQRRIAEILDTIDATIQQTEALIAKLKQVKAGLDEHGQLRDLAAHPEQFKDSGLGQVPKCWDVAQLGRFKTSVRPYLKTGPFGSDLKGEHWVEEGVPVVTIGSLGEGEFIRSELLFITEKKASTLTPFRLASGDLVFSRVADVGRSVVVGDTEDGWIMSSNLMRISLMPSQVVPAFAHLTLVSSDATVQQVRRSVNAGGREIANTAVLSRLLFAWPPFAEQSRIVKVAAAHYARVQSEVAYRDKLRQLKQGLMDDLLTGRVGTSSMVAGESGE